MLDDASVSTQAGEGDAAVSYVNALVCVAGPVNLSQMTVVSIGALPSAPPLPSQFVAPPEERTEYVGGLF